MQVKTMSYCLSRDVMFGAISVPIILVRVPPVVSIHILNAVASLNNCPCTDCAYSYEDPVQGSAGGIGVGCG